MPPLPGAFLVRPHMAKIMRGRSGGDALFRNLGGLKFARTSEAAGVADGGWAWGTEFVDLDGKGREDLLVVNGMFRATTGVDDEISFWNGMGREGVNFHDGVWGGIDFGVNGMASRTPKKLFWNRGDGTFEERAFVEGFDTLEDTRGLAYADLDGDGAPEVVVSCFRGPLLVYRNGWGSAPARRRPAFRRRRHEPRRPRRGGAPHRQRQGPAPRGARGLVVPLAVVARSPLRPRRRESGGRHRGPLAGREQGRAARTFRLVRS